ncbi:MAG: type IV pilus secretin PilQ [Geobacteraceae bacterium]
MKTLPVKYFLYKAALLLSFVVFAGCAQSSVNRKDANSPDHALSASLQAINVSNDGSVIEITADRPITYTFYKMNEPVKVVIDLTQTDPGHVPISTEVNMGNVKRIDVARHSFAGGFLSRIEVVLLKEEDFSVNTDPADKNKLLVSFVSVRVEDNQAKREVGEKAKEVSKAEEVKVVAVGSEKMEALHVTGPSAAIEEALASGVAQDEQQGKADVKAEVTDRPSDKPLSTDKTVRAVNVVGDGVEIIVSGYDSFNSFKLTKPDRLVVDVLGVKSGMLSHTLAIDKFGVSKARVGVTTDKVRIVFDVTGLHSFRVVKIDNGLKVLFTEAPGVAAIEKPAQEAVTEPVKTKATADKSFRSKVAVLEGLDFKLVDGVSQIAIKAEGDFVVSSPAKTADGLLLVVKNCQIPEKFQRALDTSSFASVVQRVIPYQVKVKGGYDARFLVKLSGYAPSKVREEGGVIYWEIKNPPASETPPPISKVISKAVKAQPSVDVVKDVKPIPSEPESVVSKQPETPVPGEKKAYTGRKVTLEFSDAEVRKIFQLIAEVSNLNFLIADDVSGTISIKLVNVPWDQALDVILESKNLEMRREGNIVQIKPKGKFISQEQENIEAIQKREKGAELKTVVWDVNYATLGAIKSQLEPLRSANPKANISIDARSNKIIITDIEEKLYKYKDLLEKLDTPEKQVMIEARIVEASSNFTRDLGVQWGTHFKDGSADFAGINALDSTFGGVVSSVLPTTTTGGAALGMSFGKLISNVQLDMKLSAAATIGQVKIISSPKVVTLNNRAAKISQGQSIPYQTTSAEGTKTEFVEAALTLEVTPHITADGNVSMKIKASNNSPGTGTPPPINKKEATTELVVKNGETTVIGGIYVDNDIDSYTGVPFLMDIPLLGWLFKSNTKSKNKTELLIFITPKIIS